MAYTNVWTTAAPLDTQAANQGAVDFRSLKLDTMQRVASFGAGLLANRPTPEVTSGTADWTGVMYWATDTKQTFRWNGASWDNISTSITLGSHFSDTTQANITNPGSAAVLNTVTVPGSFTTGSVVRIRTLILTTWVAGTPVIRVVINGSASNDLTLSSSGNSSLLLDAELLALSPTVLEFTGISIIGASTVSVPNNGIAYTAGTPFNFVTEVRDPFTGTVISNGMSAFIV
jgi:hypothetical protein